MKKAEENRAIGGWWSIGRFYVVVDNLGLVFRIDSLERDVPVMYVLC
jgi:hypothetical protein